MISLHDVLEIHKCLIDKFGGAQGVRDSDQLDAAIHRPFATFDGIELYPTGIEKAASILESVLINHPFVDGNKRTGYVLMRIFLLLDNFDIPITELEKYDKVIETAAGKIRYEEVMAWLKEIT